MARPGARRRLRWRSSASAGALATALVLLLASPSARAASYGPGDTGVVNVSQTPNDAEGESSLAVDPLDPNFLLAGSNQWQPLFPGNSALRFLPLGGSGFMDTAAYISHDGGRTWTGERLDQGGLGQLKLPLPDQLTSALGLAPELDDAANVFNTDQSVVFDDRGAGYFESGDIHGVEHGGDEAATVWRTTDRAASWTPPQGVKAVSALRQLTELDRPWLAIDRSGGPRDGELYLTYETTPFADIPPQVYAVHSTDHGASWSYPPARADAGFYETQFNARQIPTVGADGALYIAYDQAPITVLPYPIPQIGAIRLAVARSTDGGLTFQRFVADADVHRVIDPDEATPQLTEMISAIAADPSRPGRVAVAWPEASGPSSSRIELRYSSDGGQSWSDRIDVADDPPDVADQHDHVTMTWLSDGSLYVMWRDRRCCGGGFDDGFREWVRRFAPDAAGRLHAGKVVELTDSPQSTTTGRRALLIPDEFDGLTGTSQYLMADWTQDSGLLTDIFYRRIPLSAFGPDAGASAGCVDERRFVFALHHPRGERLVLARAYVNGRLTFVERGRALRRLHLARLPIGNYSVVIDTRTDRGTRAHSVRAYAGCVKTSPRTSFKLGRPGRKRGALR
jgi:hypothetical protein